MEADLTITNRPFTEDLLDPESPAFNSLKSEIEAEVGSQLRIRVIPL